MTARLAVIAAVGVGLFAIRLTGLPNFMENEYRLGAYVLDVLQHGHWLCPQDSIGNTDKPPLLAWLAAVASWPLGRVTPLTLYLPSALATVVGAWLIAIAGSRRFGDPAGFLGALAYLLSDVGAHQVATARWDALFTLTVTIAALLAFAAWTTGRGWTWFWLAAAASTLTKGPLGVLLAALGLLAVAWERRSRHPTRLRGAHAVGVVVFLLITVGWFVLAYRRIGPHLVANMVGEEFLPQTSVLPQVDLVITHGGNNTVTECLWFGKPMVVLPLFWDQYDNAQRIDEKGFGWRLDTYGHDPTELIGAIERLLADEPLRQRLSAISARLQQKPGTATAADLIERLTTHR